MSAKYNCECGSTVKFYGRGMHKKTQKHLDWMETGRCWPTGSRKRPKMEAAVQKERVKERQNKKIECECGCTVSACNIHTHRRSSKHLMLMKGDPVTYGPRDQRYKTYRGKERLSAEERSKARRDWEQTEVKCECGGFHTKGNKGQHYRTKKHLNLMKLKEEKEIAEATWVVIKMANGRKRLVKK